MQLVVIMSGNVDTSNGMDLMLSEGYHLQDVFRYWGIDLSGSEIFYLETITDWSWGAILLVYFQSGKYFVNEGDEWNPQEVSQEDALVMMIDFEESLKEIHS